MLFGRLIGIVPLGIGLTVLVFAWSPPYSGFGSTPLFFRVFASFLALAFILFGGAAVFGPSLVDRKKLGTLAEQLKSDQPQASPSNPEGGTAQEEPSVGYACSSCGAPLSSDAEVSPHGDVKCSHCDRWFNIYGRSAT